MTAASQKLKDFSGEVATVLPEYRAAVDADPSKLDETIDAMMALEKKCRLGADALSTAKVADAILHLFKSRNEWKRMQETISVLCKRRAQLQKVQETIIQTGASFVDDAPDDETRRSLIETLRGVSEGKIFVEMDRARLTRRLAAMDEAKGDVAKAADIMQELQVETIGTMEAKEKMDFLLEQIRLCLAKKDYVRAEIISKKVDVKALKTDDMQQERKRFYQLMIQYHMQFGNYREIADSYQSIYHTPLIQSDESASRAALTKLVLFSILAPFDSETSDLISRIRADRNLDAQPELRSLLQSYIDDEIITWPLDAKQLVVIEQDDAFGKAESDVGWTLASKSKQAVTVHDQRQRWRDLRKRIVQHNLRVIALYYENITSSRLSELLNLNIDEVEASISELVTSGQLHAKIDRPQGEISFVRPSESEIEAIDDFGSRINSLLKLVDEVTHLVNKEQMQAKILQAV